MDVSLRHTWISPFGQHPTYIISCYVLLDYFGSALPDRMLLTHYSTICKACRNNDYWITGSLARTARYCLAIATCINSQTRLAQHRQDYDWGDWTRLFTKSSVQGIINNGLLQIALIFPSPAPSHAPGTFTTTLTHPSTTNEYTNTCELIFQILKQA